MAFTFITVTRTYKTPAGYAAQGVVKFTPSVPMVNSTTTISSPERVELDKNGALSISLAANNDPGTTPNGTTYRVVEDLTGQSTVSYDVIIPYNAAGGTVNLATLAPVTAVAPAVQYVSSVNGQSGAVTVGAGTDATTSTKGISVILGGTADTPTVPWASLTSVPDATTGVKGVARILGGTATAPTVPWASLTSVPDATTGVKGVARILGGTADAPTVPWASLTGVDADLTGLAGLGDGFPSRTSGTWAARTAPQLLGDIGAQPLSTLLTRMSAAASTITYAASITPDASVSCVFNVTATGNLTIADISNGIDGQSVNVRVTASGATRTLTVTGVDTYFIASGGRWSGWFNYAGAGDWQFSGADQF